MDKYEKFLAKATAIISEQPYYSSQKDLVKALNRKFRLNREEALELLKDIKVKC